MQARLPTVALVLGVAGVLPFIGLGLAALSTGNSDEANRYLLALVAYGAVVLAFLGGVHWGFVLHPAALPEGLSAGERRDATRLGLGVLPSLIGWAAMLMPLLGVPEVGLAVLVAGYLATIVAEVHLRRRALMPSGYVAMRLVLSAVVVIVLVTVLSLRLIGATIIF
jgi:hypothetical protein